MNSRVSRPVWLHVLLLAVLLGMLIFGATSALAYTPGVPSVMSTADINNALLKIEATSRGTVDVFTLTEFLPGVAKTRTEAGRELYVAKVGYGPIKVWVTANMHGGEALTSESVINVLKSLAGRSNSYRYLLRSLTMYFVPSFNPDGRETFSRGTTLMIDGTNPPQPQLGPDGKPIVVDLNRDWFEGESVRTPKVQGMRADETKAWFAFFCKLKPDYYLDLHHQGVPDNPANPMKTTMSLGISLSPDRNLIPSTPDPRYAGRTYKDMTRQLQGYVYNGLKNTYHVNMSRYQLFNFFGPGKTGELDYYSGGSSILMMGKAYLNYLGMNNADWSCPSVFFEFASPSMLDVYNTANLRAQCQKGVMAYLSGIATGAAWNVSPQRWYDIPALQNYGYYTHVGDVLLP